MFKCYHYGQCCEDPFTQIAITLGDIQRMCTATSKSAVQLYKEKIIGIQPFHDADNPQQFELDLGLYIPCQFRKVDPTDGIRKCEIYTDRPINCRMFPYWILADAPVIAIKQIAKDGCKCLAENKYDAKFEEERKIYKEYKDKLSKIFEEEVLITDTFLDENEFRGVMKIEEVPQSKDEMRNTIIELVNRLQQQDFTPLFQKVDEELQNHRFTTDIPTIPQS